MRASRCLLPLLAFCRQPLYFAAGRQSEANPGWLRGCTIMPVSFGSRCALDQLQSHAAWLFELQAIGAGGRHADASLPDMQASRFNRRYRLNRPEAPSPRTQEWCLPVVYHQLLYTPAEVMLLLIMAYHARVNLSPARALSLWGGTHADPPSPANSSDVHGPGAAIDFTAGEDRARRPALWWQVIASGPRNVSDAAHRQQAHRVRENARSRAGQAVGEGYQQPRRFHGVHGGMSTFFESVTEVSQRAVARQTTQVSNRTTLLKSQVQHKRGVARFEWLWEKVRLPWVTLQLVL